MRDLIGKKVLITGKKHPWFGEKGIVKRVETTALGAAGAIVDLDNGTSCFVFSKSDLRILKKGEN